MSKQSSQTKTTAVPKPEKKSTLETGEDLLNLCGNQVVVRSVIHNQFDVIGDGNGVPVENYIDIWVVGREDDRLVIAHYHNELPVTFGGTSGCGLPIVVETYSGYGKIREEAERFLHKLKGDPRKFPRWFFKNEPNTALNIRDLPGVSEDNRIISLHPSCVPLLIEYHRLFTFFHSLDRSFTSNWFFFQNRLQSFVCDQLAVWARDQALHQVPVSWLY